MHLTVDVLQNSGYDLDIFGNAPTLQKIPRNETWGNSKLFTVTST